MNMLKKCLKKYCKDKSDYHNLYVETDTLLLADVFEIFRESCIKRT